MKTFPQVGPERSGRWSRWVVALGYVAFIYATLGLVRAPITYLRSHGLLRIFLLGLYATALIALLSVMTTRRSHDWWRYAALLAIAAAYFFIAREVKRPEEQIHFFEYGLVGVLFARALRPVVGRGARCFIGAVVLATVAGWLDEILQGFLPSRHYDLNDIALNAVSAILGLMVYGIMPAGKERYSERSRSSSIHA